MNYYERFDKSDYEFENAPLALKRGYEELKDKKGVVISNDENGEFLLVPTEALNEFVITCLSREDIKVQGYNPDELTDKDMQYFADKMCDNFIEYGGYWDTLDYLANEVFNCPPIEEENEEIDD